MEPKKFNVTNSYGTKQAWRWIKKNKWLNIGQPITEKEFGIIIKTINNTLQDQLLSGKDILLPKKMGRLEVRKYKAKLELKNGKVETTYPINWQRTKELWAEDERSRRDKILVRYESPTVFSIYYNKSYADYNNKSFYKFLPTRSVKKKLSDKIINGKLDALILARKDDIY